MSLIVKGSASGDSRIDRPVDELRRRINPALIRVNKKLEQERDKLNLSIDSINTETASLQSQISSNDADITSLNTRVSTIENNEGRSLYRNYEQTNTSFNINQVPPVYNTVLSGNVKTGNSGRIQVYVAFSPAISSGTPSNYTFYLRWDGQILYSVGAENLRPASSGTLDILQTRLVGLPEGKSATFDILVAKDTTFVPNSSGALDYYFIDGI